jgi:hypothetical protein
MHLQLTHYLHAASTLTTQMQDIKISANMHEHMHTVPPAAGVQRTPKTTASGDRGCQHVAQRHLHSRALKASKTTMKVAESKQPSCSPEPSLLPRLLQRRRRRSQHGAELAGNDASGAWGGRRVSRRLGAISTSPNWDGWTQREVQALSASSPPTSRSRRKPAELLVRVTTPALLVQPISAFATSIHAGDGHRGCRRRGACRPLPSPHVCCPWL